jgi:hypothetical protein
VLRGSHAEQLRLPGRPLPRRLRPAPRLVPVLAADRLRHRRPRAVQGAADARLRRRRQGPQDVKSLGNVIAPQKISDTLGADILRLWVAATDYSGELSISDEILKRVVEAYRRIRNTLRFLLANTSDFDAAKDMLPVDRWLEIDRYALAMTRQLQQQCEADYGKLRVPPRRAGAADLLLRRPRRLLPRHPQGPPVHHRRRRARAPAARRTSALWHITQTL